MDCCSKCPPADYRLHSSMFPSSGRLSQSTNGGNVGGGSSGGAPIPGAFYNHLHPTSARYPHSMYRLTTPNGNTGYNVIGPPPPAPSSLSSASSVSSNSSVSPSSQSPASPNLYPMYERYGNYGSVPPYGYRSREDEPPGGSLNYANLNHRLDMNRYYGHSYDNYNRFMANFGYRNTSLDGDMLNSRSPGVSYGATYGYPPHPNYRPASNPAMGSPRYYQQYPGRIGPYTSNTHPFNYMHLPHSLDRGAPLHHQQPFHPQMNGASSGPYVSPVVSDIGSSSDGCSTYGSQRGKSPFGAPEIISASSPLTNGIDHRIDNATNCTMNHLRGSSSSNELEYHMRPSTPHVMARQQYSTDSPFGYDPKDEKMKKFKDRDKYNIKRNTVIKSSCSNSLDSPAPHQERTSTPFHNRFTNSSHTQPGYMPTNQNFENRLSPSSTCSPYSWNEQYSPKSVRRKYELPSSPSANFTNKNRVLECDFIPSKKSRKNTNSDDNEYSPEMREELKDITPLPGFQQAFGSTEIGRFSETFLNTPESVDYFCNAESESFSPQPWENGDSLEGPHYNLHIGATVVQPESYTENNNSTDLPIENNYFSGIQCSDY